MIFVGGNPVGYGLPERAGLLKKDCRQVFFVQETCKAQKLGHSYW